MSGGQPEWIFPDAVARQPRDWDYGGKGAVFHGEVNGVEIGCIWDSSLGQYFRIVTAYNFNALLRRYDEHARAELGKLERTLRAELGSLRAAQERDVGALRASLGGGASASASAEEALRRQATEVSVGMQAIWAALEAVDARTNALEERLPLDALEERATAAERRVDAAERSIAILESKSVAWDQRLSGLEDARRGLAELCVELGRAPEVLRGELDELQPAVRSLGEDLRRSRLRSQDMQASVQEALEGLCSASTRLRELEARDRARGGQLDALSALSTRERRRCEEQMEDLRQAVISVREELVWMERKPHYLRLYDEIPEPRSVAEVLEALESLLRLWARDAGVSDAERERYSATLARACRDMRARPAQVSDVQFAASVLWTNDLALPGQRHSLCSLLCRINRDDRPDLLTAGAVALQKAINSLVVTRRGGVVSWPADGRTYRGTGLPRAELSFFERLRGEKYRSPMPLASTKQRAIASHFLSQVQRDLEPVMFVFCFRDDIAPPCVHANYLESVTQVRGEEEILFSAYSAFQVGAVEIKNDATWMQPHAVMLEVCPDNRLERENLPLAKWH